MDDHAPMPSFNAPGRCGTIARRLALEAPLLSPNALDLAGWSWWMTPPRPPVPSSGLPGRFTTGVASSGRIIQSVPSIEAASALVVARMIWLGRDDTYPVTQEDGSASASVIVRDAKNKIITTALITVLMQNLSQ